MTRELTELERWHKNQMEECVKDRMKRGGVKEPYVPMTDAEYLELMEWVNRPPEDGPPLYL